jgi:Kef-type K+ transport system membrane component KefB
MVTVAGVGLIVAALAEWLGFSLAIGALFAGLAFSRDPQAVRTEGRFEDLHTLFVPFFFMRIGMDASPAALVGGSAGLGVLLLGAAIAGKFIGAGLPAWWVAGPEAGVLIGLSMIPRAEIAMVVMYAGLRLGPEVVTERIFGAVLMVVLGTCLLTPWLLSTRLQRHQHRRRREAHAG